MGCDIHTIVERRTADGWEPVELQDAIFEDGRHYGLFGWLANVRNYSAVPPLTEHRGLPADATSKARDFMDDFHSVTWVSASEFLSFDYHQMTEDRRVTGKLASGITSGACTAEPGHGEKMTFGCFLGEWALAEILRLCALGDVRLVIGFDS